MNTVQAVFLRWTRISKRTLLSFFAKIISKFFFCQVKVGASNCISLIVQFWCGWIKLTMALGFSSRNQWNKTCSQFPRKVSSWFFFFGGGICPKLFETVLLQRKDTLWQNGLKNKAITCDNWIDKQRQTKAKKLRMVVPFFSYACMWRASRADH